ncbi:endonuclease domain-containing protein [Winogradskyella thalassocola]|uniref:Very-short-patch-repair endonuclease n=1 Tax=Winogradskyella thalassocola TaxID=262004 RepID=A0A1G8FWS1_9FLAO|nr:endonuclease domain-containing protein [Winogradskyella thalassocola]SDH86515.1 Very-short-patch-repair endonuclease [Winogradskyella thalassocola]
MPKQNTHTKKALQEYRRALRNNLTPSEAQLWKHLKSRQLSNRKFQRQHSIGYYIVDFYCAAEKLIIELDGEIHNNPKAQEYDKKRTQYLENLGYKVIRFENKMVFDALPSVLGEIQVNFKTK